MQAGRKAESDISIILGDIIDLSVNYFTLHSRCFLICITWNIVGKGMEGGAVQISFASSRVSTQVAAIVTRYGPGSSVHLVSSPSGCRLLPAWEPSFVILGGFIRKATQ